MKYETEIEVGHGGRIFDADVEWEISTGEDGKPELTFTVKVIHEYFEDGAYGRPRPPLSNDEREVLEKLIREKWEGEMERRAEEHDERMRDR